MIETKTKAIGNHTYTVAQLGALQGRRAFTRLAKVAGPALAAAAGKDGSVGEALGKLAACLNEDDVDYLCDLFARQTSVSGGTYGSKAPQLNDIFDLHFAGNYGELLKWLAFCLEVNFGDFFGGMLAKAEAHASGLVAKEAAQG